MAEEYKHQEIESMMVNEDVMAYPQGVTIPIHLPSTGEYSVEYLKKELTDFAMKLLQHVSPVASKTAKKHTPWVQEMAKYRCLPPVDGKQAMLDSLDERFG